MSVQNIYIDTGFDKSIDVSANTRKFQTSVVIKQDTGKSGILTYLQEFSPIATQPESYGTLSQIPNRAESDY